MTVVSAARRGWLRLCWRGGTPFLLGRIGTGVGIGTAGTLPPGTKRNFAVVRSTTTESNKSFPFLSF